MTTTMPSEELAAPRNAFDQDWMKLLRVGSIVALAQAFIALSGMPVGLDKRTMIEPILSLGYLSLLWLPFLIGYSVGNEVVLEGMTAHAKGAREAVAGLIIGIAAGLGLSIMVLLLDNFDLRDPLVNWSPQLLELLTFENGVGYGFIIWIAICGAIGLAGGLVLLAPGVLQRAIITMLMVVIGAAVLETMLTDLLEGFKLEFVTDRLYASRGGVNWNWGIGLAVVAGGLSVIGRGRVKQAKATIAALEERDRKVVNSSLMLLLVAAIVILPLFLGKITNELLANVGLFVLLALGLNIVVGLAGILDLGYVAFFAVGGYSAAVLTTAGRGDSWPDWLPVMPWFVALLVVVVLAALVGLFIGAPVIRMRGDYLAIVTLGFGEIIRLLFLSDWLGGYTGGAQGITNIPGVNVFGLATVRGTDPRAVFYLVAAFCAIAVYVSWRLERSRLGRAWMAIREDESVAEAMGINTVNAKLMAFVVGAILAAFSGAIFSAKVASIFPSSFIILVSIVILVVVIFGGMGNIAGVIAGAFVLIGILGGPRQPGLLQEFSEYKLLIYGALLIWMMLKRPEGLVPNVRRTRELHQDEFLQDAWLKGQIDVDEDDTGGVAPV